MLVISLPVIIPDAFCQFPYKLLFEQINPNNSKSFGIVEDIQQDTLGFIWIGAKDGLFRYDGIQFTNYFYDRNDTNSLSNNVIRDIFIDSRGKIWVGTENGLNLYEPQYDKFHRFYNDPEDPGSLSGNNTRKIIEDENGDLWIATFGGGICWFTIASSRFIPIEQVINTDAVKPSVDTRTIYIDSNNNFWIGTADKGVLYFARDDFKLHQLPVGKADGKHLQWLDVRSIVEDSEGKLWIGTNGRGIACYDRTDESFVYFNSRLKGNHSIASDVIWSLCVDSKQNLWACTDGGGLLWYNKQKNNFLNYRTSITNPNSISSDVVRVIYEDHAGNYWIGNFNAPVNYVNSHRKKFRLLRDFDASEKNKNQNKITSIFRDSEKNLWICTDGAGLYNYDLEDQSLQNFRSKPGDPGSIRNNKPLCIVDDPEGNLWIGLYEGGLSYYRKNEKKFVNYFPDGTENNPKSEQIWDIIDRGNILWIAGNQGIESYDLVTSRFNHNPFPYFNEPIYSAWNLMIDSKNKLWVGTINGLFICDEANSTVDHLLSDIKNPKTLSENWVLYIFEDENNRIWVGTNGGGLNLWKGSDNFDCFTIQDGLAGNVIDGILSDNDGNLWISTNNGISKFDVDKLKFKNFDSQDGLQDNQFTINSCYKDRNGTMYFGGINGLSYFNPDEIISNDYIPPIVITGLDVFSESDRSQDYKTHLMNNILYQDEIDIYPDQVIFTIHYAALNFSHPRKNQYRYKLDGFDDNWNEVGNQHWATYTNLHPGKYKFRVIGSNNDQIWNHEGADISVIVHPPFYRTVWFIILIILSLGLLIITIYRIRVRRIRNLNNRLSKLVSERTHELEVRNLEIAKQNAELENHRTRLEELVEERTQDLVIAKERAEESDRLKTAFLENLSHEIRTPMNAIIGFINLLTEKIDDKMSREYYLRIIHESGRSMLRLIEDIIDFSRMQTGQLQPEYSECNASELIRNLVSTSRERASRENPSLSILTDIPQDDIIMFTDEKKLRQIFSKLIENSMKYTEKGFIKIGVHKHEENNIIFYVEDSGVGIEEQHIEKIFDRFFTIEEDENPKNFRGSGLGLPFAKIVTELLGGQIWVESKKSEGSIFYFKLPFMKVLSGPREEKKIIQDKYFWPGKTLLVAEDEESNYLLIEAILRDSGVTIIHVNDGVELLEKINDGAGFDLVLLDLKMPRMGGINAMKIIREIHKDVPVIVQTAYDQISHREQCLQFGCNEFLVKPLRKKEFLKLLNKYLS